MIRKAQLRLCRWVAAVTLIALAASAALAQGSVATQAVAKKKAETTHASLCELTEVCVQLSPPVITGVDPSSAITPGGQMVVIGTNFSMPDHKSGDIILTIGSQRGIHIPPSKATYQQPYREAHLKVLGWSNGHAYGEIPKDIIDGVMDGPAAIQVRRSDGKTSNSLPVQFTAQREYRTYPTTDMKWDFCSTNADENQCNGWSDFLAPWYDKGLNAVAGSHIKFLKQTGTAQSGVDGYKFNLKNGWVWTQDASPVAFPPCSTDSVNVSVSDSTPAGGRISVNWQATCEVQYLIVMTIHGPWGVPWK